MPIASETNGVIPPARGQVLHDEGAPGPAADIERVPSERKVEVGEVVDAERRVRKLEAEGRERQHQCARDRRRLGSATRPRGSRQPDVDAVEHDPEGDIGSS